MILDGIFDLAKYYTRPFKWWLRKDKTSDHLSYAMSIEAVPNPQGWITGALISFVVVCDITGNETTYERIYNFPEKDVIYVKNALDDQDVKDAISAAVNEQINLPLEAKYAREVINMQVMIEGVIVYMCTLALLASFSSLLLLAG